MSANEKMAHLQNSISGSARTLIGGMVCDGSSYEEALNALKERYGQEIDVVHSTLKNVFSCPPPKPFDAGSLERYHGAVHGACSTLRTMGFDGDLRSCEILRRVVSKLPMNLRKSWAEHSLSKERPTLLEFDDWLRVQVRVLLRCEASAPSSSTTRKNVGMFATTTSTPPGGGGPVRSAEGPMVSGCAMSSRRGRLMSELTSLPATVCVSAACDQVIGAAIAGRQGHAALKDAHSATVACFMGARG